MTTPLSPANPPQKPEQGHEAQGASGEALGPAQAQERVSGECCFAVAVVMVRQCGESTNVMLHHQRIMAASEDEAIGKAVSASKREMPNHQVHCFHALLAP